MVEYIDREAVYTDACQGCIRHGDELGSCYAEEPCSKLIRAFTSAPAADVAQVVRCKDCRWLYDQADDYCCFNHKGLMKITPDSYCSYGEREEGGTYDPATMHQG